MVINITICENFMQNLCLFNTQHSEQENIFKDRVFLKPSKAIK